MRRGTRPTPRSRRFRVSPVLWHKPSRMITANPRVPLPVNEPIKQYAPGSPGTRRAEGRRWPGWAPRRWRSPWSSAAKRSAPARPSRCARPSSTTRCWPPCTPPGPEHVEQAITAGLSAKRAWAELPLAERSAVMLGPPSCSPRNTAPPSTPSPCGGRRRPRSRRRSTRPAKASTSCASTSPSRSSWPTPSPISGPGMWNQTDYRPLDGFVLAVAPVQLHRHRPQPGHRAGADGQRGALQARGDRHPRRVDADEGAAGGRAARRA